MESSASLEFSTHWGDCGILYRKNLVVLFTHW